jgi:hypothetical protein
MCSLPGWRNTRTQASCTTSSASNGFLKNRIAKARPRLRSFGSSRKETQGLHIPSSDLLTLLITLYLQVSNFQKTEELDKDQIDGGPWRSFSAYQRARPATPLPPYLVQPRESGRDKKVFLFLLSDAKANLLSERWWEGASETGTKIVQVHFRRSDQAAPSGKRHQ